MSQKQRCRVCGTLTYLTKGRCRKKACASSEGPKDVDLSGAQIERLLARREFLRRGKWLKRPTIEDGWRRVGDPITTEVFARSQRRTS